MRNDKILFESYNFKQAGGWLFSLYRSGLQFSPVQKIQLRLYNWQMTWEVVFFIVKLETLDY